MPKPRPRAANVPEPPSGDTLEGRDSPLIVDDVENDGRLVGGGEDQRGMEVRLGRRAVADPAGGDPGIVLDGGRHRPADRLDILRGEVAGYREEAVRLGGVHDRQLPPMAGIELVREDLVHHLDHRVVVGDQKPRLTVGRKIHVALAERLAECTAHRLFAEMLHVEGRLALALRHEHTRVEGPQQHHMPEAGQ